MCQKLCSTISPKIQVESWQRFTQSLSVPWAPILQSTRPHLGIWKPSLYLHHVGEPLRNKIPVICDNSTQRKLKVKWPSCTKHFAKLSAMFSSQTFALNTLPNYQLRFLPRPLLFVGLRFPSIWYIGYILICWIRFHFERFQSAIEKKLNTNWTLAQNIWKIYLSVHII